MAFASALLLLGLALLARLLILMDFNPPGDEVAYGFIVVMLVLALVLSEIVALMLGVAGVLQRRRRRYFALFGIACSLLTFAAVYIGWFAQ
jgi:hypothetical protein